MPLRFRNIEFVDGQSAEPDPRSEILKFLGWLKGFFSEVHRAALEEEDFQRFFIPRFPSLISHAFIEFQESGNFDRAWNYIETAEEYGDQIHDHGLSGHQWIWKVWNVKHWLERFIEEELFPLFDYLLNSINALLKSILDNVPGGGAIMEFKEAIENSMDRTANAI